MNEITKSKHTQLIYGGKCIIEEKYFSELKNYLDKCHEKYNYQVVARKYEFTLD